MDTRPENNVLRDFNSPVKCQKFDKDVFSTPRGGNSTPKENLTPHFAYKTPMGGRITPSRYNGNSNDHTNGNSSRKPRKLYNPVIPEHAETLQPGMAVFVKDASEGWISGNIADAAGSHLVINVGNQQREVKSCDVALQPKGIDYERVEDLTKLSPLSTPAVLHCLKQRYAQNEIYTRAGETLVAVNPFKVIPGLYDEENIRKYGLSPNDSKRPKPHIYEMAELAFRAMKSSVYRGHNQSIIVSGESGAGKTESASYLMKYLVTVSGESGNSNSYKSYERDLWKYDDRDVTNHIEQRILISNPILESFGNASTLRNHNSSRFGKFIQLHFDNSYQLEGATVDTYLLEKTRVAHQVAGECTFHVFYQIVAGLDSGNRKSLHMENIKLSGSELRDDERDRELYKETITALHRLGLVARELGAVIQILCLLVHLMQVKIVTDKDDDVCAISEETKNELKVACEILSVEVDDLEKILLFRRITATHKRRMSVFSKPCSLEEAQSRLNCLMMTMYSSLFNWLVQKINSCTKCDGSFANIGILDIYGFESFEDNSLEQLCINYANEKLQQHFVTHFLRDLQADYQQEAVNWEATNFTDNRPCLDLLEANPGVFALINEECYLNRPSNSETLTERIVMTFKGHSHLCSGRVNAKSSQFLIQHYAAPVSYSVENLVEKNKDNVPNELVELIQRVSHVLQPLLTINIEPEQPGKKKRTVLTKFKNSLDSLMTTLEGTQAHYIRCIKPNPSSSPSNFQPNFVLQQLEANGVVEAVDICRKGYPTRIVYEDFLKQFGMILRFENQFKPGEEDKENAMQDNLDALYQKQLRMTPRRRQSTTPKTKLRRRAGLSSCDHSRKLCASILRNVFGSQITDWSKSLGQFGRTKIFLKHGQLEKLESVRLKMMAKFAFTIQCAWRRYLQKKALQERAALLCIQAVVRGWLVRLEMGKKQRAASIVQRAFRRHQLAKMQNITDEPHHQTEEGLVPVTPNRHEDAHGDAGLCADLMSEVVKAGFSPTPKKYVEQDSVGSDKENDYVVCTETTADSVVYHIIPSPVRASPRMRGSPVASPLAQSPCVTPVNKRIQSRLRNSPSFNTPRTPENCRTPMGFGSVSPFSPSYRISTPRSYAAAFHSVAAAVSAAFMTRRKFHLAGAFNGIPYFEAKDGILSRRRMPKVHIRFHTRPNPLLKCGHYISQEEFQCSLTDCLND